MDRFLKTDLHFFLGTTKEFHSWAANPFLIIGVFPIGLAARKAPKSFSSDFGCCSAGIIPV